MMACSMCKSANVRCIDNRQVHVHECHDCGNKDFYRQPRP